MQYKTPVVSIAVILILLFFYFTRKRLPLRSTKWFSAFLILSLVNILAELSTLYTIYHIDTVKPVINRFCHQVFIGSLDVTIYFLFMYVDTKARRQKRNSIFEFFLKIIPLIVALIMVVFGKLEYHIASDGSYSYGPMAQTVYLSVAVYITGILFLLLRYRDEFNGSEGIIILSGIAVWAGIAIFQFFVPTVLISSMGVMLMVVALFFSFENPQDFNDIEINGMLNKHAFDLLLSEYIESKRNFYLVTFTLSNDKLVKASVGYRDIPDILKTLSQQQYKFTRKEAYHVKGNTICIFCRDRETYAALLNNSTDSIKYTNRSGISFSPEYFTGILTIPLYAKTVNEVLAVIDYISEEGVFKQNKGLLIINDEIIKQIERLSAIEALVENAIEHDGLDVYYQPIYSTEKKAFISAEALVRLKDDKTLGYISPELFIPIVERQGMIKELGSIVFSKVCAFATKENLYKRGIEYIEVNISGIQGVDENLPELLRSCMDKHHIPPRFINLEITETASISGDKMLSHNMNKLRMMGCGFSMDDFGTGYSNLSQMIQTHFDLIKLDKSLLWPCFYEENKEARILLESCIALIQRLGLQIVAEGVETAEQMEMLTRKGVNFLQGFYYSKPVCEKEFLAFLDRINV